MALEIENTVQSQKTKAAKSLVATYLKNSLVFQLDNESIPSVDTLFGSTTSSITLKSRSQKRKRNIDSSTKLSVDVVFLNNRLKKVAVALLDAYTCSNVNTQNIKLVSLVNQVGKKIDSVKNLLGEVKSSLKNIKDTFESMQEMIDRVLQALTRINTALGLGLPIGGAVPNN